MCRRLCLLLLLLATCAGGAAAADGAVVAIGGALRADNDAVWGRIVALAGGPGARFVVIATASDEPAAAAASIIGNLQRRGGVAESLPVAATVASSAGDGAVRDLALIDRVQQASGVFFSGGAQARLADTLQPGGRSTPLLDALQALHARGGVVAGTSAGAAVLSAVMFRDAPSVRAALRLPLRNGFEVDRGFGFLPDGVVVDQHFLARGRVGRLLPLMTSRKLRFGIGVDEDAAAVVQRGTLEVIGRGGGVLVVDLVDAQYAPAPAPFNLRGARLHLLQSGDRFDLATRVPQRATPLRVADDPHAADTFVADMLAPGALADALQRVAGGARAIIGLSFDAAPIGFEWRLRPDSAGVLLDVTPVRMARPLYRPLSATAPR